MKVTVSVPGKFQTAYHWARYLDERGELDRLITTIPFRRAAGYGVPKARTVRLSPLAYWYHAYERWGPRAAAPHSQLAYSVALDRAAALLVRDATVFNGWSSTSLHSMRIARRRGAVTVLHTGSAHIRWQAETLQRESRRWSLELPITHERLLDRAEREYEEAEAILVPSQFSRGTFLEHGVDDAKVHVVPWAVQPLPAVPVEKRERRLRILFVGTCSLRKGIPYLLGAFARLDPERVTLRLVGPPNPDVVRVGGGLPDGAVVVGRLRGRALAAEFAAADAFVMPSVEDGSAYAIAEAMAAGLPVIASDQSGADAVVHGVNGLLVPAADEEALHAALCQLTEDDELRASMSEAARHTGVTRTWNEYGGEVHATVQSVCERR